jgi:ubiquinone/menaquinone biosynthesis C-methylase UbiE
MKKTTHKQQQKVWDKEHRLPEVLLQMDACKPSSGVKKFWDWLQTQKTSQSLHGLEMCCGKGRNVIWLAQQNIFMTGFDFSSNAIIEARKRSTIYQTDINTNFFIQDATLTWELPANTFDFVLDCFATTDIESQQGREKAVAEMIRVLKPGGFILVYVMSEEDTYHKDMIAQFPAHEPHSFLHPKTKKFEKVFTREELIGLYSAVELIVEERIPKKAVFNDKEYSCNHYWMIFKKH